ncbi:unnamed protein product [Diatraea saccharalis]|uniref:FAST kinase domain-containing protein 5 n=1 Tax=Diatraea saccharalis TaxID=40085 RepID=A0A9N9WIB0_9NEOP|nr:unnamed protein product [Diatraea saccharalis]
MSMCLKILQTLRRLSSTNYPKIVPDVLKTGYYRNIHFNSILKIKMFMEYENRYAYDIMENKGYARGLYPEKVKDTLLSTEEFSMILKENWTRKSPSEIFKVFSLLGMYSSQNDMCISNNIFDSFVDHLTDNIKFASDAELQALFYSLLKWPETESIRTRNYIEVWAALDDECLNRFKQWSIDENLSFLALFYMLNVSRVSDFSQKALQRIASKAKQLSPGQLVQTMFYIGVARKPPFDMHNLEVHLEKLFAEFTLDELAIMSMGFFKSKTPIRNTELTTKIIHKIIENSKETHEVSLAALLKVIRYSYKANNENIIYNLLEKLQYEVPRLSIMCNVHLALVGMSTLTLHKECLDRIAELTLRSISETRLKDLERLILTYGTFDLIPNTKENFFENIIKELRKPERLSEIERYGRSFACCIAFLGCLGIYPVDLMNKVLSKDFLLTTYGKHVITYGREVLSIHNSAQLFCSDQKINLLNDKSAIILAKKYTDFVPRENYQKQYNVNEKVMLDIMRILKACRGGDEYVVGDHIVTHHQRGDIIICNDSNGSPVKVREHFYNTKFGLLRRPPDSNSWVALVIAGKNGVINNTDIPTGPFKSKLREIEALGFYGNLIISSKYNTLTSDESKADYLNNLIKEATGHTKNN